jgi:hypothetical protein
MADRGRNERCGCGSGFKTKRCCGTTRGPSGEQLERAFLADQSRRVARPVLAAALEHGRDGTVALAQRGAASAAAHGEIRDLSGAE